MGRAMAGSSFAMTAYQVTQDASHWSVFHAALEDVSSPLVEPDNPPAFFALGLVRREEHAQTVEMDMGGFHHAGLVGPAACLPAEFEQIAERIALEIMVTDLVPLLWRDRLFAT